MNQEFAAKLKWLRKHNDITQETLGKVLGVGKSAISNYESGVSMPDSERLLHIADYFNVSIDLLLGREQKIKDSVQTGYATTMRIPVIATMISEFSGQISHGLPACITQYASEYIELPEDLRGSNHEYFALKIQHDHLTNLHISQGDIVLIRRQPTLQNGDLAVVLVDGHACHIARVHQSESAFNLFIESGVADAKPLILDMRQTNITIVGKIVKAIINL